MTVLITSGFQKEWCHFAESRLSGMGVSPPLQIPSSALGPHEILSKMLSAYNVGSRNTYEYQQVTPGKTWELMAADMFLANADQDTWGWAAPANLHFLDFWCGFDPSCRFVLLYDNPSASLVCEIQAQGSNSVDVESYLSHWLAYHTELLDFYHRHSSRCLLVNMDQLNGTASKVGDRLASDFGLNPRLINEPHYLEVSPMQTLIAEKFTSNGRLETQLVAEIESVSDLPSSTDQRSPNLAEGARQEILSLLAEQSELGVARSKIESLEAEIATSVQTLSKSKQQQAELTENNELLTLQLAQVRDELGRYFSKYNDLKAKVNNPEPQKTVEPRGVITDLFSRPRKQAEPEIVVDFRQVLDGTGWYNAETDGRWAGPDPVATVNVPALSSGTFRLELTIINAMSMDFVTDLELEFDGEPLTTSMTKLSDLGGPLAPLRRLRASIKKLEKPFPITLSARLPAAVIGTQPKPHRLKIICPGTITPSQLGAADNRLLSICAESIRFVRIG